MLPVPVLGGAVSRTVQLSFDSALILPNQKGIINNLPHFTYDPESGKSS